MRRCVSLSFVILPILLSCAAIQAQTVNSSEQTARRSPLQSHKWTEAEEAALVAKAQQGDAKSQMWLGCAYEQGWFGNTDYPQALTWFERASAQGDPDAENALGQMYADGEGVTHSYATAATWYRKAAEQVPDLGGAGQGRNNLGLLYLDGRGVPQDYVRAYMWFSLDGPTNPNLALVQEHMTSEQVAEARRLAADWRNRHDSGR